MANVITQEIQDSVSSLYIAFFGRAPDADGFDYWCLEVAGGESPFKIAADFALSAEWQNTYGSLTDPAEQVNLFYQNTFGRNADAEGLAYWVAEIEGGLPFSSVAYQIIYAAYNGQGDPNVDQNDYLLVSNKIEVAEYFATVLKSNDTTIAQTAFNGVTQNPESVTAAENRLTEEVETGVVTVTVAQAADLPVGYLYNLEDSSANLAGASAAILNGAINIGATTTATVSQTTIVQQAQNTGTKSIPALSDTAANLAGTTDAVLAIVVGAITATDAATEAQATTVASFTQSVIYSVADVAANIVAGPGLNRAVDVAVTNTAVVAQATIVEAADNSGEKSVAALSDTVANISGSSNAVLDIVTGAVTATNAATVAQAGALAAFNKQVIYNITDAASVVLGGIDTAAVAEATGVLTTASGALLTVSNANTLLGLSNLSGGSTWNISDAAVNMQAGRALNSANDITVQTAASAAQAVSVGDATNTGSIRFLGGISDGYESIQGLLNSVGGLRALAANTAANSTSAVGSTEADTINMSAFTPTNNPGGLTISGLGNNDLITGSAGADIIIGGEDDDNITGGLGVDTFRVDLNTDTITDLGQGGADLLVISAGATAIATIHTAWTATSGTVNTGANTSANAVITTAGLAVNLANASVENAGSNTQGYSVTNTGAATTMTGSAAADSITGGTGHDTILGGNGDDTIRGG